MKIRNGFVSNSSSSSFVVLGKCYDREELWGLAYKKLGLDLDMDDDDFDEDDAEERVYQILDDNFEYHYEDEIYVGINLSAIQEDETLRQFRERVKGIFKEKLGDDIEPQLFEACINSGGGIEF